MSWLDFFKAPEPEPQRGFTISTPVGGSRIGKDRGVTISTGASQEQPLDYTKGYNIYRDSPDPYKSSSIATRDARMNIADNALSNIRASTDTIVERDPYFAPVPDELEGQNAFPATFTRTVPAGQTFGNLPKEPEGYVVNPLGRYMPHSEQVRQQKILQNTYAPRPTYDLLSVIGEGEKKPIQYSDAYFKSGSTRADSKFDPNYFLNSVLGTDLPVDTAPKGDVFPNMTRMSVAEKAKQDVEMQPDRLGIINFITSKGFNPDNVVVFGDQLYDRASGAKLDLPNFTEIMSLTK